MSGKLWILRVPKGKATMNSIKAGYAPVDVGVKQDVSDHLTLADMLSEVRTARPDLPSGKAESRASTLLSLKNDVKGGDIVLIHGTGDDPISGVCSGVMSVTKDGFPALVFTDPVSHTRKTLGEDIKNSMKAHIALSRSHAINGFTRINDIRMSGNSDTGPDIERKSLLSIGARMEAYELADLVADLLRTDGYVCNIAPPGPDGGVDIYAGKGILGIGDSLLVQVKSGGQVISSPQIQQIIGISAMCNSNATLIVSWSGFTRDGRQLISKNPFKIVGWTGEDLMRILIERKDNVADKWQKKFDF